MKKNEILKTLLQNSKKGKKVEICISSICGTYPISIKEFVLDYSDANDYILFDNNGQKVQI